MKRSVSYFLIVLLLVLSVILMAQSSKWEQLPPLFTYEGGTRNGIVTITDGEKTIPYVLAWDSACPQCYKYDENAEKWIKQTSYSGRFQYGALATNNKNEIFLARQQVEFQVTKADRNTRTTITGYKSEIYTVGKDQNVPIAIIESKLPPRSWSQFWSQLFVSNYDIFLVGSDKEIIQIQPNSSTLQKHLHDGYDVPAFALDNDGVLYSCSFGKNRVVIVQKNIGNDIKQWEPVGNPLNEGYRKNPGMAINGKGEPYIVLELDISLQQPRGVLQVMKFNGSTKTWEQFGPQLDPVASGMSPDDSRECYVKLEIVFGKDDLPIVGVLTSACDKIIINKYNNTEWERIGEFDDDKGGGLKNYSMVVSQDGTVFVAYDNYNHNQKFVYKLQASQSQKSSSWLSRISEEL